ncbi:type I CRISPR-associated protein Cas7 [Gramella sp. AN32]|uniref:Type I CRISPR-associated protein Cas7 n=1 Tax=Christiangramia antarctica TaxID=2058158 RepID=A0ABW5X6C5_9FLAO|nr:type I CRISPR-associated protein Cas7 [Gramella sp. AN32]
MPAFNNRVYGFAIIKSINSNYNADFSGQPRKLPNGKVYATDKALKYSIRNFWRDVSSERVFYFKRLNNDMNPFDLVGLYKKVFGSEVKNDDKNTILNNLLSSIDVRFFGATFAPKGSGVDKKNISIHGPCQITHGLNRFPENIIYTEQIMAPVSTPGKENEGDKGNTTLGTQSKLEEGHYVHHFSVNPKNIADDVARVDAEGLTSADIDKLKEGLRKGASYYDSAAKSGTENELLFWIQLKEGSTLVMPSFIEFVDIDQDRTIDLKKVTSYLQSEDVKNDIDTVEIYYNKAVTKVVNEPEIAMQKTI